MIPEDPRSPDPLALHTSDEAVAEYLARCERGEAPDLDEFCAGLPAELRETVANACVEARAIQDLIEEKRPELGGEPPEFARSPQGMLTDAAGARWIGEYRIQAELGRGGMGIVYLALQSSLERRVALKVLPASATLIGRQVERFRREALNVARLSHPGIVPILAVGESEGIHYFAMEYVVGGSLHDLLQRWRAERGRLERAPRSGSMSGRPGSVQPALVARIAAEVAEALHYAHSQGVIHRDIKPQNILLDASESGGRARLVDFGLAQSADAESLTRSGDMTGTPYYMSPEQARARSARVGPKSDVFSLGVVLYEMLTLERPFQGDSVHQVLFEIAFRTAAPVRKLNPKVPKDLETICLKAMEKDPEHRYASAGELAADLRRFLNHEAIRAKAPGFLEIARRKLVAQRALAATIAIAALALALVLAGTSRRVEARVRAENLDVVRAASGLDAAGFDALALGDLVQLRRSIDRLQAEAGELADPERALLDEVGRTALERGLAFKARFLDLVADDALHSTGKTAQAEEVYGRARALLPEDAQLVALEDFRPRLTLASDGAGDRVLACEIDVHSEVLGPPIELGTTPLERLPMSPGFYRIVVLRPGFGFAELSIDMLHLRETHAFEVALRAEPAVTADMIQIPAGTFRYGIPGGTIFPEREESLPAFWIDRCEVSNREYKDFVDATGHRAPVFWQDGYDEAWDDLPVVGVSWDDARSFALWAGKRLPTAREWEKAARGPASWIVPWEGSSELAPERAVVAGDNRGPGSGDSVAATFERYLRGVRPVDRGVEPGPYGLLHTLGNVAEWTASPGIDPEDMSPSMDQRILKGGSWDLRSGKWDLTMVTSEASGVYRDNTFGFRCARSLRTDAEN